MNSRLTPPPRLAALVWALAAGLYLYGFYQRVAPAVITHELMGDFAMGAAALGNLSAFYFYSYVFMQVPTGVLVDHWGPRRVLAAGAALAAGGSILFAAAPSFAWACIGRLLIGASVGVAFVALLKLSGHWFHASRFALLSGLALCVGIVGAVSAGVPLRLAVDAVGWRAVMGAGAVLMTVLGAAIWWIVRDDPAERGYAPFIRASGANEPRYSMLQGLRATLRQRNVWLLFVVMGGISGPMLAFGGLWGVPFLHTHYRMTTAQAAGVTSLLLVAWAVGGPLAGWLSDRMGRRKPILVAGSLVALAGWSLVFLVPGLPVALLVAVLFLVGAASGCVMVGFAVAKESSPAPLAGTATGVANMGNMMGGMLMQPAVGWVLDQHGGTLSAAGVRVFDFAAYRAGFALMLAWLIVSVVLAWRTRETFSRPGA